MKRDRYDLVHHVLMPISHDWNGPQKSKKNSLIAQCGTYIIIIIIIQKLETLEINNVVVFSLVHGD